MRALLSLILVAAAVGCQTRPSADGDTAVAPSSDSPAATTPAPDSAPITTAILVRTDKQQYKPGETVTLTLENHANETHAFNPCHRVLERQSGTQWTVVPEPGRICTMEAWLLEQHATRSGPTELPETLEAGQYRIAVPLTPERPGAAPGSVQGVRAVTEPFAVTGQG